MDAWNLADLRCNRSTLRQRADDLDLRTRVDGEVSLGAGFSQLVYPLDHRDGGWIPI